MSAGKSAIDYVIDGMRSATGRWISAASRRARHVHRDMIRATMPTTRPFRWHELRAGLRCPEGRGGGRRLHRLLRQRRRAISGPRASRWWAAGRHDLGPGGGADILLSLALNDIGASIGVLGVEAVGNSHANRLTGGARGDRLRGWAATMCSRAAADLLKGGSGDDLLRGGSGRTISGAIAARTCLGIPVDQGQSGSAGPARRDP